MHVHEGPGSSGCCTPSCTSAQTHLPSSYTHLPPQHPDTLLLGALHPLAPSDLLAFAPLSSAPLPPPW